MSLSPRAEAALMRCVYLGTKPTVEALRDAYKGTGRDMWLTVLKELRTAGYVEDKTYRIGQRFETVVWVTEAGIDYLKGSGFPTLQPVSVEVGFSDPLFSTDKLHSPYSKASLTSKELGEDPHEEEFVKVNVEVDDMSSWGGMFESTASDDERLEERARAQREKKAEYQEAKTKKHSDKIIYRHNVPKVNWSSSDISYEFIHRVGMTWGLPAWQPNMKRLNSAFHTQRMKHETNGEIEDKMLDLFFSATNFEKYNDPDVLWKMLASRWGEFANQAKAMVRTDEEVDAAKAQAQKSQEWLYE
jgi:hypothetical protein